MAGRPGQEVHGQHEHGEDLGERAEHEFARPQDAPDQRGALAGQQAGELALDVVLLVELAQLGVVVLKLVQVRRDLFGQGRGLGGERRDGGGQEDTDHPDQGNKDHDDRRPARPSAAGQPAYDRVQAAGDEEGEPDDDQDRPGPDQQFHETEGHRDPGRAREAHVERRAPVHRPARLAHAAGPLGDLVRGLDRLLHPALGLVGGGAGLVRLPGRGFTEIRGVLRSGLCIAGWRVFYPRVSHPGIAGAPRPFHAHDASPTTESPFAGSAGRVPLSAFRRFTPARGNRRRIAAVRCAPDGGPDTRAVRPGDVVVC